MSLEIPIITAPDDAAEAAAEPRRRFEPAQLAGFIAPVAVFAVAVGLWEFVVQANNIAPYILPAPSAVIATLIKDWGTLSASLLVTLRTTAIALVLATLGGVLLGVIFAQSRLIERSLYPFAVILQVTPIVSVAPLLLVYLDSGTAMLVCAFIVAFFPILSNTTLGLASTDPNLRNLFKLYGAGRWRELVLLRAPSALPYFLGGLRIGGGLALIGAVVAEIAAGSAGQGSGLAYRIVESGYRLNIPRMFAALLLISFTGIVIYAILALLSHLLLRRWHESALDRGG
ncbi:NitT/TauT family transport system permease protein [Rhizobiales bacterium GAS113]|nr:NitT/TauT family transport system permease protein [Rhizobiales bacterium GAS113]